MNLDIWELTNYAKDNFKANEQIARFFYYWIGSNIKYDSNTLQGRKNGSISDEEVKKNQNVFNVFNNRKGICEGYANLFKWFMDQFDIETVVIIGYIRDERNHVLDLAKDAKFGHAWNAIKLNGKWILVDPTWGSSTNELQAEFYFNIKPEWAIITHYPMNSKWQLLKNPLSLQEFNNSKFINPAWFYTGFSEIPKLLSDNDYYYFVYKKNQDSDWIVNLLFSNDNIHFSPIENLKSITKNGYTYCRFNKNSVPNKAFFKVNIVKYKQENHSLTSLEYSNVFSFKL
ncbi:transglutaminase domain-containing protein [Zhouia sp. PK063]|uniref:transglutaminase domain-containing protein n=1 Tax=Zhouia sp. PK063 TaxID=3373602 RepID=UPI003792B409